LSLNPSCDYRRHNFKIDPGNGGLPPEVFKVVRNEPSGSKVGRPTGIGVRSVLHGKHYYGTESFRDANGIVSANNKFVGGDKSKLPNNAGVQEQIVIGGLSYELVSAKNPS
jgi:hypothetical protein